MTRSLGLSVVAAIAIAPLAAQVETSPRGAGRSSLPPRPVGDVSGNPIAFDPAKGGILWHSAIGQVSNAPQTYMVQGKQYILAAAGDTLYAFTLY